MRQDRRVRQRYSRQTMFPRIGEQGQEKLSNSSVVIIGCGALGGNIASLLARAGVGKIRIVDRDFIEYHNLQRQTLFDEDDWKARLPKAIAAERRLKKINSSIQVEGIVADANYTNIEGFCRDVNVILDGLDNLETRLLINDVALKHRIPWVYGGAIASSGMTMTIIPGETPCLRCVRPALPEPGSRITCETVGIVGTVPAIIGSLQATEAIKIIVGAKEVNRRILVVDVWQNSFHYIEVKSRDDCPACHGNYEFLEQRFPVKTTSLCGQSRAVQVVDTSARQVNLSELAAKLKDVSDVNFNEFMLSFTIDDHEVVVFPDGRTIVGNTIDEALAREIFLKYVAKPLEQR